MNKKIELTVERFKTAEACALRLMLLLDLKIAFCVAELANEYSVSYSEIAWRKAHNIG